MNEILQGTTPSIRYPFKKTDLDVTTVTAVELTLEHKGTKTIHGLSDVSVDAEANTITYHFTQAETLALDPFEYLHYQIRCKVTDGNVVGTRKECVKIADLMSEETL